MIIQNTHLCTYMTILIYKINKHIVYLLRMKIAYLHPRKIHKHNILSLILLENL